MNRGVWVHLLMPSFTRSACNQEIRHPLSRNASPTLTSTLDVYWPRPQQKSICLLEPFRERNALHNNHIWFEQALHEADAPHHSPELPVAVDVDHDLVSFNNKTV
mmetsp:Transcript_7021/g.17460  ORF Transcript_7021/g.17460 Transcript_7021/m.17460 type:complete len:105 (-) Transcript_7021:15-329(-)